jgi:hypothetical protein
MFAYPGIQGMELRGHDCQKLGKPVDVSLNLKSGQGIEGFWAPHDAQKAILGQEALLEFCQVQPTPLPAAILLTLLTYRPVSQEPDLVATYRRIA